MPFLALLKMLSLKEWLVIAALLALLAGGGWLYRHGEQHIEAQDAKLAALDQHKIATAETVAQTTESQNALIWKQTVSIPAVPDIGIVCKSTNSSVVPKANKGVGAPAGDSASISGEGPTFDPSGALLTRAAQADAQITYLQNRIRELETLMNAVP
jgi:hypothetical protein